jgi:hypothetical protein
MLWEEYENTKEKMKKIAKMQEKVYELTEGTSEDIDAFNELSEKVLNGLIRRRVKTSVTFGGVSVAAYIRGIGTINTWSDRTTSIGDSNLHDFFRKKGDKLVKKLKGKIPDGKLEVYKKLTKASKKIVVCKDYKQKGRGRLVWINGKKRYGRFVVGGVSGDDYNTFELGEMGMKFASHKAKELNIYDEGYDEEELFHKYMLIEQVYDESIAFLERAIKNREKCKKRNTTALDEMRDDLAPYLALEQL